MDVQEHTHGKNTHTHAWASVSHIHVFRAICSRDECKGCGTHDIHPSAVDASQRARDRAGEGVGY